MSERKYTLFLDDDQNRAAVQYQRMTEEQRSWVIWCQTTEETIVTLKDYRDLLAIVTLDHDLGGEHWVHPGREDCGMEVIRWLERLAHKKPEDFEPYREIRFIVHSWNTGAAPKMVDRLRKIGLRAAYIPFGTGHEQVREN